MHAAGRLALVYAEAEAAQRRATLAEETLTLTVADARAALALVEEGREPLLRGIQGEAEAGQVVVVGVVEQVAAVPALLHLQAHGDFRTVYHYIRMQHCVIPGIRRRHSAFAVGACGVNLLQLSVNPLRIPSQAKRHMDGVNAQVAHDTDFTAELDLPLPIHRLIRIKIAAVMKATAYLQQLTKPPLFGQLNHLLRTRQERKL